MCVIYAGKLQDIKKHTRVGEGPVLESNWIPTPLLDSAGASPCWCLSAPGVDSVTFSTPSTSLPLPQVLWPNVYTRFHLLFIPLDFISLSTVFLTFFFHQPSVHSYSRLDLFCLVVPVYGL